MEYKKEFIKINPIDNNNKDSLLYKELSKLCYKYKIEDEDENNKMSHIKVTFRNKNKINNNEEDIIYESIIDIRNLSSLIKEAYNDKIKFNTLSFSFINKLK